MNLTAPFKETALPLVDEIAEEASALGAVNCLVPLAGGKVAGRNTDPSGVLGGLAARGVEVRGKRCLVIGAGGAGKAAARALVSAGGEVVIANRTREKAEALAVRFGCASAGLDALAELASSSDIIASTLVADTLPDPESWFPRDRSVAVVDADYKTGTLAKYAAALGLPVSSGADWLVAQALPAYELFMGESLPDSSELGLGRLSSFLASSQRAYGKGRKIALIGLMGAGKTSTGKALSSIMRLPFVDSDKVIEEEAGMTIPGIFASEGESGFRARESRAIERITSTQGAIVVSVGGGAATMEENAALLRERTLCAWLYVSPKTASLRSGAQRGSLAARPLLTGTDPEARLRGLEAERRGAYASAADILVSTEGRGARSVAEALYEEIDRLS
jgi:shikimate dehydrogenase